MRQRFRFAVGGRKRIRFLRFTFFPASTDSPTSRRRHSLGQHGVEEGRQSLPYAHRRSLGENATGKSLDARHSKEPRRFERGGKSGEELGQNRSGRREARDKGNRTT